MEPATDISGGMRTMTRVPFWVRTLMCCALLARGAGAQAARGVIRDSSGDHPLSGVVVLALDSLGATASQAVSDSSGRFSVNTARARTLRFMRIGYRMREVPLRDSGAQALSLALERVPPVLDVVRVSEREVCQNSDPSATAWRMWDQARAGLTASIVTRAVNPMTAVTELYRRRVTVFDQMIRRQSTEQRSGTVERPFTAATPTRLVERGYLDEDSTGRTFHGPDVDALLHESFALTHCFRMRPADAAHRGMIGLAFHPIPSRDTMVDVAGVLWFAGDGSALSALEFQYTGLEPAALKASVGGTIGFRTLGNGAVFVERWSLRVPVLSSIVGARLPNESPGRSRRMMNTTVRVSEFEEYGGVVRTASWRDGTKWNASVTGVSGVVREPDDAPVPGAIIELEGTGYRTIADRDGEFVLSPLIPGRYTLTVTDTSLLRFASARRTSRSIEIGHDVLTRVSPRVESLSRAVAAACKGRPNARDSRIIAGRVSLPAPSGPVTLRASWATATPDSGRTEVALDAQGNFSMCVAPPSRAVAVRLRTGSLESDTAIDAGHTRITTLTWKPTLRAAMGGPEPRIVRGTVTDSGFRPVARATVSVAGYPSVTSNDSGAFVFRLASRDAAVFDIRRIGFALTRFSLQGGGDTTVSVTLLPGAQQLEGVTVRASSRSTDRLRGFEDRLLQRSRGAISGSFVTAAQIEQRSPTQVTQMLIDIPGITIERVHPNFPRYAIFGRSSLLSSASDNFRCPANVYLDGTRVQQGGDAVMVKGEWVGQEQGVSIDDLISPGAIAGIEVYRVGNQAPPEFQALNGTCAVVVIWSKNTAKPDPVPPRP